MNRRQKIKKLKKENQFLLNIVNNTDEMKRLYLKYNKPLTVSHTYDLKRYKTVKGFAVPNKLKGDALRKFMSEQIAKDLHPVIEKYMQLEDYGDGSALEFRDGKEVKATFDFWVKG